MQDSAKRVQMNDELLEYVTRLAEESRRHSLVSLGISPRGALSVCRMAKSKALIEDRNYVIPADVQSVFTDVCAHRILLSAKAKINDTKSEDVLNEIIKKVKRPDAV